tara:strand:- start:1633 stop:1785 length:153 start_codon:yes stop_codon:yes gene_type:complete
MLQWEKNNSIGNSHNRLTAFRPFGDVSNIISSKVVLWVLARLSVLDPAIA